MLSDEVLKPLYEDHIVCDVDDCIVLQLLYRHIVLMDIIRDLESEIAAHIDY